MTLVRHPLRLRTLDVVAVERPTPRLVRVRLAGPDLEGFVSAAPDDHVKVLFPADGSRVPVLPELGPNGVVWPTSGPRPLARDYTPRLVDGGNALQLDVVLHDGGAASSWAARAQVGDVLGVAGPRGSHVVDLDGRPLVLAGDETALPAIARWLAELDTSARVFVFIEVADAEDELPLPTAASAAVTWLHRNGRPAGTTTLLLDALRTVDPWPPSAYTWVAAEAAAVRAIRTHLLTERGLEPDALSARGYWKLGESDHQEPHDD